MGSGGPWRAVCNASESTEMPTHIHTHLNGAVGITKGRQTGLNNLYFQTHLTGQTASAHPQRRSLPLGHLYRTSPCRLSSICSQRLPVSRIWDSGGLAITLSLLLSHPSVFIPAFLLYWFSILFFPPLLSISCSPLLSCVLGLFVLTPVSGRANARISFRPMKSQSWQHAPVLNLHKCRCNLIENRVMESMSSGLDLVRRASSGQAPWGEKIKGAALLELKRRLLVELSLSFCLDPYQFVHSVNWEQPVDVCSIITVALVSVAW